MITPRLSHEDRAALVGASRPIVSNLKELASDGVLTKRQGRYMMLPSHAGPASVEQPRACADAAASAAGTRRPGAVTRERVGGRVDQGAGWLTTRDEPDTDRLEATGPQGRSGTPCTSSN